MIQTAVLEDAGENNRRIAWSVEHGTIWEHVCRRNVISGKPGNFLKIKISLFSFYSFFGNQTSMTCEKCSPECETCNGLGEFDCLSCRHYTFYNPDFGNRMECVTDCPTHTRCSTIGNVCEKCYENE